MIWNWHIEFLCNEVQKSIKNYFEFKKLAELKYKNGELTHEQQERFNYLEKENLPVNINISPSTTKSTIFSRLLTGWVWAKFPHAVIINITRDTGNNKNFSLKSRELIESEKYKELYPEIELKDSPSGFNFFENTLGGVRYGLTTLSSGTTGKHADIHIYDDIASYTDYYSNATIESVERAIDGLLSRFKDKSKGLIFNVMQRLAKNDTTAYIFTGYDDKKPKKREYKNICLPAVLTENVEPIELKEKYINDFLDPIRLNEKMLEQAKIEFGTQKYNAQYLQEITEDLENLMYPILIEEDFNINEVVSKCFISASFSDLKDEGKDSYATIYTALYKGRVYVLDVIYNTLTNSDNEDRLIHNVSKYQIQKTFIEKNNQQSYLKTNIEPNLRDITDFRPIWTKDNKIELMKSKSHYIRYYVWQKQHENHEYQKAKEHIKKFPRNGKAKDDGIEDVLSKSQKYFSQNRELLEQLINKI